MSALHLLDVQILHIQRVVFDELAAGFDDIAHEDGKDGIRFHLILNLHLQHGALVGVHGGFPQLRGIHFAQPFEALHGERFLPHRHDVLHQFLAILDGQLVTVGSNDKRLPVIFMHALVQVKQAPVFGAGEQLPVENSFGLRFTVERQEVDAVFLVQLDVGFETIRPQILRNFFQLVLIFEFQFLGELGPQQGVYLRSSSVRTAEGPRVISPFS